MMKGTLAFVALFGYLCCVSSLPAATTKKIDDSIDFVPYRENSGDQPIIDTGVGFDGGFSNPFSGLFENLDGLMNRIRQQMESLWSRFPGMRPGNYSNEVPEFPEFGFAPFGDVDLGKGNSTSETKIIDGHKVVVNQTEYHKDTPNGSAFFKVRVIDFQPSNASTEKDSAEVTTTPPIGAVKDREPLENSVENEIFKNKEAIFYQPLEHAYVDSTSRYPQQNFAYVTDNSEWNDLNSIEQIADNSLGVDKNPNVIDLSRDTYVNDLMANSGATTNPDAETIDIVPRGFDKGSMDKFQ